MTKHPLELPAESAGELYYPTPVTPEDAFQAIGRLRKEARDEIDRLIRFLDDTDNHMEREEAVDDGPCDDRELEPSLCGVTADPLRISGEVCDDDLEGDDTPNGRSAEDEPSLGSAAWSEHSNQEQWSRGNTADLEDEHDGAEPEDLEANLGSLDRLIDQRRTMLESRFPWSVADGEVGAA